MLRGVACARRFLSSYNPEVFREACLNAPLDKIRNFCIIAHVDHGKSTLADRILEKTGFLERNAESQVLDSLEVERARGITVKAQTATMLYNDLLLNLIDVRI